LPHSGLIHIELEEQAVTGRALGTTVDPVHAHPHVVDLFLPRLLGVLVDVGTDVGLVTAVRIADLLLDTDGHGPVVDL
jgi:hypothetical protein